ncbi:hypothetical protein NLU13_0940 [Sarocladium strictum]|uniref:Major facilitator superfamily (MFS) profile domain-containing protein n=1 Tax=Sarocladium strictum TaxID=5046 RepID=A0AA39GQR6_SARSR|nr:hypothetical protein NLU13_0940 [Sarocladium strictum]
MTDNEEVTPLLASPSAPNKKPGTAFAWLLSRSPTTIFLTVVIMIATLGSGLTGLPTLAVVEDSICQRLHRADDQAAPDDRLCKSDDVQRELSFIMGFQSMMEAIPSLVLAVPYGLLADRVGRRPVLILSFVGMILGMSWMMLSMWLSYYGLPFWVMWLSAFWQVIGAGDAVMISMVYAMISDAEPAETRTDAFYLIIAGSLVAHLVAVPLSTLLMLKSPWIPLLGGLALVVFTCICLTFIPESFHPTGSTPTAQTADDQGNSASHSPIQKATNFLSRFIAEARDSISILHSPSTSALLLTFIIQGFTNRASGFMVQYLSKRFYWSISRAGLLVSIKNAVDLVLHIFILPACSRLLMSPHFRFNYDPYTKDLVLARVSIFLLAAGSLLIASPSLVMVTIGIIVFTLGAGFESLCRGLISDLVDPEHTARVYSLIGVIQASSTLSAGPAIAWLFGSGMQLGGGWIGLPYLATALLCCLAAIGVYVVKPTVSLRRTRDQT